MAMRRMINRVVRATHAVGPALGGEGVGITGRSASTEAVHSRLTKLEKSRLAQQKVTINRGLGSRVVTLNNPKDCNALTTPMVTRIQKFYKKWEHEDNVHMIILKGAGNNFCSGADVKELSKHGLEGNFESSREFLRELYTLQYLLGTYKKMQVSIVDGHAIGGACALTAYSQFQLVTEEAVFASPESHMGFHPDGGSSFLLSCLKGSFGEYLALTGEKLDCTDMIMTGLARYPIARERIPDILFQLQSLDTDDSDIVEHILEGFEEGIDVDPDSFLRRVDAINRCFSQERVEDIVYALEAEAGGPDYAWYRDVIDNIRAASPLSQKLALKSIRMARQESLPESLQREYRMSCRALSGNISKDFYEGVRAHILDKDHNPQWNPSYLELVSDDMVDAYFQPFENGLEELQLPLQEREGVVRTADSSINFQTMKAKSKSTSTETPKAGSSENDMDILNWAMGAGSLDMFKRV